MQSLCKVFIVSGYVNMSNFTSLYLGNVEYAFIAITPRSTLTQKGPVYESDRSVLKIVCVWLDCGPKNLFLKKK